ncbi:hypothetical protein [Embleya sp. AB8]|uniref:hypothetical protein n=1 Tax=Embleya sp. AB8 TaxID=3156304 RepID=UPI003C768AD3
MPRNVDSATLKKLGYSVDQTPGDPASITDASLYLAALTKKAADASTKLAGLVQEGAGAPLMGEAAGELRTHVKDQLKLFVDKLAQATQLASAALSTYSTELLAAQQKGQEALDAAAPLPELDPGLAGAKATMATARTMYLDAVAKARKTLGSATALKTSPKTVAEEFWDFFKIFTIVLTVLGVLFGGPLGLLAFGANLVVLGKTIADFVHGKATGLELFLNILGVLFPSTKALLPALLSGLKSLLVGLGKGVVNLFRGAGDLLSLLGTGLRAFNLAGWKFALAYAAILTGGLIFKGGALVGKLLTLPFKAIVWFGKTGWQVGKQGFAELKGWGSLGIVLPVAGNEIAALGLSRALKIGFWERGVLGSQKDFVRAALSVPPAAAGGAGKFGGRLLDKSPLPTGLAGKDLPPFGGGPSLGIGHLGLNDMPRLGSSFDTAVFVPAASGLYTAHGGLGVYSFGNTLLGHEGLQAIGGTIGHGVAPQLHWNSLHDVLNQATGGVSALHGLNAGALSPHTIGGAVDSTQSFAKSAIGLGDDVRMTPLPEIRRLTHGDTTLTSHGTDRFVSTVTDPLTNRVTVPNSVHAPNAPTQTVDTVTTRPLDSRPAPTTSLSPAPVGAGTPKVDVFDLLAPAPGKAVPPTPPVPPTGPHGPGVSALHQDNALGLLANGSRTGDQLPAVSARFTPVDLAGGNSAGGLRPDLAGGQKVVDTVSALVGEKIPLRLDPPPHPPTSPVPTALGREPLPPNALAHFGAGQRDLVGRVLDDLATGPGPGGKSAAQLPGSRLEAWYDYAQAKVAFDRAGASEHTLKTRLLTGDTSTGVVRAELMVATAARANAGLALADATAALKAWGVDPALAAPAIADALAELPGLRGGMRPGGDAVDIRPRTSRPYGETGGRTIVEIHEPGSPLVDRFEIHGPIGKNGRSPLLHDGYRLPDGTYQVFDGPRGTDRDFRIWAGTDGEVLKTGVRQPGGDFKVIDVANGHFQIWGPRGADDIHPVLADARLLDNGDFKVFEGPMSPTGDFQIWTHRPGSTDFVADHVVLEHWRALDDGTFRVFDGPMGDSTHFQVRGPLDAHGTRPVLEDAYRLPDGTYRVFDGPRSAGRGFEIRSDANGGVLKTAYPGPDGTFHVHDGPPGSSDDFRIWGPRDPNGNHPVLGEARRLPDGTWQVRDVPASATDDFRIWGPRDENGAHSVLGHGRFRPTTQDFVVTRVGDPNFRVWGVADADGIHPVLKDAYAHGDTFHVYDGPREGPRQSFEIWGDTQGTLLGNARFRPRTDDFLVTNVGDRDFRIWGDAQGTVLRNGTFRYGSSDFMVTNVGDRNFQIWGPRDAESGHAVLKDAYAIEGGRYQVFDGPRGGTENFQVWGPRGADGRYPVLHDAYALGDGTHQVYTGPRNGTRQDFQVWAADRAPIKVGTHQPGTNRFKVVGVDREIRDFEIWGPRTGDQAPPVFKDAHALPDGRYQVFDGPPTAGNRNFEVWADDAFRIDADGGIRGRKVTQVGEHLPGTTEFRVTDRLRGTWEKWDGADLVNHRLVEYPLDGPFAGAVRRIDHTTDEWHDIRPTGDGGPGHGVAWANLPFRNGTVEHWPAGPGGEYRGIRSLVDGNGSPVFARDPAGTEGHWIEAGRNHAGKWKWVEKTEHGRPVASGNRYVRWDRTSYDVVNGAFDLNARHLFGGKVRDLFPQLDGGTLIAEKSGMREWSWQKWDRTGLLQARGRLDFRAGPNHGFQARVTHVRVGDTAALQAVGDARLVAFERFASIRGGLGKKFFSAPDKARGTRQYTFEPNARSADQFKYYAERNYVNEEVATFSKFGEAELKARRIWQQRFDPAFFPGRADFPGSALFGDDRLFRYWTVSEKGGANGTQTIERSIRVQRMDGTWQDFNANGELLRESRVLADGRKIEFTADLPGRGGTWREVGGTATGPRVFDDARGWIDYLDSARTIEVRKTVDAHGTVREFPGDRGATGPWIDRNRFGQVVARRDELGTGFVHGTMRNKPDGRFTWQRLDHAGNPLPGAENSGVRTTNRAGAQMWGEGFDDGFKDFGRIDGRDVLVHERKLLGDGRVSVIERQPDGSYQTTVKTRDGLVDPAVGGQATHVNPGAKTWQDHITIGTETHTVREGRGDAIREYHVTNGVPDPRHWDDFRNGARIRSFEPISHNGTVVGYLEKDLAYLQQRIYDADGHLVVHQGFSTRIFEKAPAADPNLFNKLGSKLHPDKLGAKGVDSRFKLVGRGEPDLGALNEFRGYNRGLADTNRRHWGAADAVNGSKEWTFEQKVWTKVGMEFMQDFGLSVLAGMITEWINDGNISGSDWEKIFLNSAVSASFAGLMARFHELKFKPGSFSPKQFKDGLTANDFGKPFNTNPYFGDNWKTDWSNFDTALRWRSGMYKFGLGLAVNPFVAFVNGSINAAVFGDKNGVKHYGLDALKFGGVAALGSLATGAFGPGAFKFAYDAYGAGRFWRKAGLLDITIKLGEKLIDAQLNKLFQNLLALNNKYLYHPKPENGRQP